MAASNRDDILLCDLADLSSDDSNDEGSNVSLEAGEEPSRSNPMTVNSALKTLPNESENVRLTAASLPTRHRRKDNDAVSNTNGSFGGSQVEGVRLLGGTKFGTLVPVGVTTRLL